MHLKQSIVVVIVVAIAVKCSLKAAVVHRCSAAEGFVSGLLEKL